MNVAIIYYSATGSVYALAREAAAAAEKAGAATRLLKVHELAPQEAIASNEGWSKHALETENQARGVARGPRVGRRRPAWLAHPLRLADRTTQAVHRQHRPLWSQGKLINKVASSFTSAGTLQRPTRRVV